MLGLTLGCPPLGPSRGGYCRALTWPHLGKVGTYFTTGQVTRSPAWPLGGPTEGAFSQPWGQTGPGLEKVKFIARSHSTTEDENQKENCTPH